MNNWVDGFIARLEDSAETGITVRDPNSGNDILVAIGGDLLRFLIANRVRLAQVSFHAFQDFLGLMAKGYSFEALVTIYEQLDNSALLDKFKEDSIKLAQIAKQTQEDRAFWVQFAKQAGQQIVFSALSKIVL